MDGYPEFVPPWPPLHTRAIESTWIEDCVHWHGFVEGSRRYVVLHSPDEVANWLGGELEARAADLPVVPPNDREVVDFDDEDALEYWHVTNLIVASRGDSIWQTVRTKAGPAVTLRAEARTPVTCDDPTHLAGP
ncbi:hypothetical protein LX15_001436 [Streptoalloteichus tenebrarius]|uniref:Uncharacterized protein n=1 Tax=Streptoalloteichus tenebrarius (strain ATCC 17920 / DSM 40477 / JCM 4838 / CBS 697.72 / NBRC 16177 / NCIMB 11028 / NRRL B-12390 / A12253. 1 / ISP 5477) TaxID=1933 RepID=A0ABT1HQL2_STRSD|nr:hypothetical protein [Streptoalloteichus tenebrarius]MCP2257750.1 hypothetical protein [Streptoalloteichus tenebrarius]BFE99891.1 hypothetical protein GCM10020241_15670 [Streptoalloteichus tenebrarius]